MLSAHFGAIIIIIRCGAQFASTLLKIIILSILFSSCAKNPICKQILKAAAIVFFSAPLQVKRLAQN